jgi:putative ABC transport system permease protein
MGLSAKKVISMLAWDQFFISFTAIFVGTGIGSLCARMFVPILQVSADAADQVPPFKMMYDLSDYIKILALVLAIIAIGLVVLSTIVKRMNVNQTLKLGED